MSNEADCTDSIDNDCDGNTDSEDRDCSTISTDTCGDGTKDSGEECDDGGASATCSAECKTITPTKTKNKSSGGGCSLIVSNHGDWQQFSESVVMFML